MTQMITQLLNVQDRQLTNRSTGQPFTVHEIFTSTQPQPFRARADVAGIARNFIGQTVEMVVRTEQRGEFTNFYADYVGPPGGGTPAQVPQVPQTQPPIPTPQPALGANAPVTPDYRVVQRTSIQRQFATKIAQKISTNPGEFWSNVNDLVRFYETGTTPMANPNWTTAQAYARAYGSAAETAQQGDPGPQEGYDPTQDDSIPF